jgi:hypothetical protein
MPTPLARLNKISDLVSHGTEARRAVFAVAARVASSVEFGSVSQEMFQYIAC